MTALQDPAELCFPQLLNASCRKPDVSWAEAVFVHFVLPPLSVLAVTLNLLAIVSVSYFRQTPHSTNLLLLSLAVADFLVGFVLMPGYIYLRTSCWFLGGLVCSLYMCVTIVSACSSFGNMVLISADRFAAICDPLHYHSRVTVGKVRLCIFLCWFCCTLYSNLLINSPMFQSDDSPSCHGTCVFFINNIGVVVGLIVNFILPVSAIVVLYMRVFVVAVSQARSMRSHVTAVTLHRSVGRSKLKAARALGVVIVVFLMCFCPYYCVSLAGPNLIMSSLGVFAVSLLFLNPCVNPVIYALLYSWFRRAVKLIVTLQILQPGSRETNVLWRGHESLKTGVMEELMNDSKRIFCFINALNIISIPLFCCSIDSQHCSFVLQ
ncbi:trace amine-associated receptor 13c-like [Betta splendens]|uniref:Trace amine-associated receptor 13c-like n=1 Tax=Betta splendens TaxID=158456 RepID=A0A8M1H8W9_BETSP|nr:trace amine-associated receptor 13c-like [Betta splendens]